MFTKNLVWFLVYTRLDAWKLLSLVSLLGFLLLLSFSFLLLFHMLLHEQHRLLGTWPLIYPLAFLFTLLTLVPITSKFFLFFFFWLLLLFAVVCFLLSLHLCGAQTHDPEIKSCTLLWLSQSVPWFVVFNEFLLLSHHHQICLFHILNFPSAVLPPAVPLPSIQALVFHLPVISYPRRSRLFPTSSPSGVCKIEIGLFCYCFI